MAPVRPQISEGWVGGESDWRRYSISTFHGQRQITISMPHRQWSAMTTAEREAWKRSARQRVESGRL